MKKVPASSSDELFGVDPAQNLLPMDGVVNHHGRVIGEADAARFFDELMKGIEWRHDEAVIFGRHIVTARKVAWYGDGQLLYRYSGTTKRALPWTNPLLWLKGVVERESGAAFNSCLLNLYHHGGEGMAWHSDDEKMLVRHGVIASLSLGAARKFAFKHKATKQAVSLILESGSMIVMKGATQENWLHSLPKSKKVTEPRINLTFRQISMRG